MTGWHVVFAISRKFFTTKYYIFASCIVVFLSVQIVAVIQEPFCTYNAKGMRLFTQAAFVEQSGTKDKFLRQSRFQCFATEKYRKDILTNLLQHKARCRLRRQRYRSPPYQHRYQFLKNQLHTSLLFCKWCWTSACCHHMSNASWSCYQEN